jgi:hypothetical protein
LLVCTRRSLIIQGKACSIEVQRDQPRIYLLLCVAKKLPYRDSSSRLVSGIISWLHLHLHHRELAFS